MVLFGSVLVVSASWFVSAKAVPIVWDRTGAFEACLESRLQAWLAKQAELQVTEDPAVANLDDAAVAAWTIETLKQCRASSQAADQASEDKFTKHVAQWRQHIYDLAADLRKKGQSD